MNILQINASALTQGSQSTRLADAIVARIVALQAAAGDKTASLTVRDLAKTPHPALDEAALQALGAAPEQRTPEQAARVALDDRLIAEVQAADALVLGVPMYNFGVPAQLKKWFDAFALAHVTFRYTETGPEGLLTGKKVYVALTRGGVHRDTAADTQVPFLKTILGFLGMTDVTFFYAEGLALGAEAAEQAQRAAHREIETALA